jgi:hypothetical protein
MSPRQAGPLQIADGIMDLFAELTWSRPVPLVALLGRSHLVEAWEVGAFLPSGYGAVVDSVKSPKGPYRVWYGRRGPRATIYSTGDQPRLARSAGEAIDIAANLIQGQWQGHLEPKP